MGLPWSFNSQDMIVMLDGITDDQAVSYTVRTIPYSGGSSHQFVVDVGGLGPETVGMTLRFVSASDFATFRATVLGTQGALNWMLGDVPQAMLQYLHLKTLYRPTDYPVEVSAQFVVISPIAGGSAPAYDSSLPWSFTPTGGSPATLPISDPTALGDDVDTEVALRLFPGSGSGPSWFVDYGPSGAEMIHMSLAFASAADFLNFRIALLGTAGTLVYPMASVTLALLTKLSMTQMFPAEGYPVLATADFLVVTP